MVVAPTHPEPPDGRRQSASFERVHVDIGALQERVRGTENAIRDISNNMSSMRAEMLAANASLADNLTNQIREVGRSLTQQQSDFAKSRSTNWTAFVSAAAGLMTVIGAMIWFIISPINSLLDRHDRNIEQIKSEYATQRDINLNKIQFERDLDGNIRRADAMQMRIDGAVPRAEYDEFKKRVDERDAQELTALTRELNDLDIRTTRNDDNLIKRPEINDLLEGLKTRIESISRNLEDVRHDFGSNYTIGDQIKSMQTQIERLNEQIGSKTFSK